MLRDDVQQQQSGEKSLGDRMLHGSVWMILLRWITRLTGLVSTVTLARLLAPSDFGIVAMAIFALGLVEMLNQSGQKFAIIRHPQPARADYDIARTLSLIRQCFCCGAFFGE